MFLSVIYTIFYCYDIVDKKKIIFQMYKDSILDLHKYYYLHYNSAVLPCENIKRLRLLVNYFSVQP